MIIQDHRMPKSLDRSSPSRQSTNLYGIFHCQRLGSGVHETIFSVKHSFVGGNEGNSTDSKAAPAAPGLHPHPLHWAADEKNIITSGRLGHAPLERHTRPPALAKPARQVQVQVQVFGRPHAREQDSLA